MQIYNMDECGISVVHKLGKFVTELGRRNVWAITSAEKGKMHTLLCCVSGSGQALPPFMIFPRKRMLEKLKLGCVPGTYFSCSVSGWVTHELYLEWFKFFIANIPPTRPVLLIEDGHASHISIEIIELAQSNFICYACHSTLHISYNLLMWVFLNP